MRKPSIYSTAHDIGGRIARIWRLKIGRGMDPDAIEAMLHEITTALAQYERKLRLRMFRRFNRPHNN
jgi:hypothetical protein